jgi:hypothetical protein
MINMLMATLCSRDTLVNTVSFCSKNAEAIFGSPRVVLSNVYESCKSQFYSFIKEVSNSISITDIVDDPVKLVGKLASSAFQKCVVEPIENIQSFITMQEEFIDPNISIEYNSLEHELSSLGTDSIYYDCQ